MLSAGGPLRALLRRLLVALHPRWDLLPGSRSGSGVGCTVAQTGPADELFQCIGRDRPQREEENDLNLDGAPHCDAAASLWRDGFGPMLIYSMSVSVDGFITDRDGGIGWAAPDDELLRFHLARVRELGLHLCGHRLYEMMLVWETDRSLRATELGAAFADVWCALPKIVFSRTLERVQGNARLAQGSVADELAAALVATGKDIEIGGAGVAAAAIELGLVDELRMFRNPILLGAGTPFLPPVTEHVPLELIETRTFGSRVIYERYRRLRDEADSCP